MKSPDMHRLRLMLWGLAAAAAVAFAGLSAYRWLASPNPAIAPDTLRQSPIELGGPFVLTDHTGKRVSESDFAGRPLLIYFGFTFCPDICPTTLQIVGQALDLLGAEVERVQPLFVSLDPARDSPAVLADYVRNFHPRLVALTGSEQEIRDMAKAYRVYYAKVENPDAPADYSIDHLSIVYLVAPDRRLLRHFTHGTSAEAMAEGIKSALAATEDPLKVGR